MIPSIGRIVHYRLSQEDADQISRRRTNSSSIADRHKAGIWPEGAQAHIGNPVNAGDILPALIVKTCGDDEASAVQLQVFLDGNDALWATSRHCGSIDGTWFWPPRIPQGK